MSRLIDADALKERIRRFLSIKSLDDLLPEEKAIVQHIDRMPPVDAVPVVRCRDCLYWQKSSLFRGHTVCRYVLDCSVVRREDDFCSRGERKDGEHETD